MKLKAVLASMLVAVGSIAAASCPSLYPNNVPLNVASTIELCNSFFVVRYDVERHASVLTSEIVRPIEAPSRVNAFHADPREPYVTPSDYARTGYDKGHMTPSGDATTAQEMAETFAMTNMTPQQPTVNRESWKDLEEQIRHRVQQIGKPVYVITGAVYSQPLKFIGHNNDIPVPSGYYKVVYYPDGIQTFYANNVPNSPVLPYTGNIQKLLTNTVQ